MSGFTAEGTEFEGGRCKACGRNGYGMASDGPRCYGCERFVLRDDGAVSDMVEAPGLRRRIADSGFDHTRTGGEPPYLTIGMLDDLFDAVRTAPYTDLGYFENYITRASVFESKIMDPPKLSKQQQKKRRPKLKTDEVLAEVDAILKEGRA